MRRIRNPEYYFATIQLRAVMTEYAQKYNLSLAQFLDAFTLCNFDWEKTRAYLESIYLD